MVNIGIIGVGFMGYTHFEGARELEGARVAAIATRSASKRAGDWTGIQGNFGPPAGQVDLSDVRTYADYTELLADPDIDLVDICLPNDLHEQVTLDAIAAGKAVLVEKPIAVELDAADRMVQAAEEQGSLLMVGQVLPFFPEFRFAVDCVRSGRYGKLCAAHFRRVITPPNWSDDMSDFRKLGGWGIDLHIHDNHFISLIAGVPREVFSRGITEDGFVNHVHSQYLYEDPRLAISCVSGGLGAAGLQFSHGYELYLDSATILFNAGTYGGEWVVDRPLSVITDEVSHPELAGGSEWYSAFTDELQTAANAVRDNQEPRILSAELARDALRLCHAEARSIESGTSQTLA